MLRVSPEFDWPLGLDWKGYVNPYQEECVARDGTGSTVGERRLDEVVTLLLLGEKEGKTGKPASGNVVSPGRFPTAGKVLGDDYADLCERLASHPDGQTPRDGYSSRRLFREAPDSGGCGTRS